MEVVGFVFTVGFFFFALYVVAVAVMWTVAGVVVAVQVLVYLGMAVVSGARAGWRGETDATPPPPRPWRWP